MQPPAGQTQLVNAKTSFSMTLKEPSMAFMVKGIAIDAFDMNAFLNHSNAFEGRGPSSASSTTAVNEVPIPSCFEPRAILLCAKNVPSAIVRPADGVCDVCPNEMILKRFDITTTATETATTTGEEETDNAGVEDAKNKNNSPSNLLPPLQLKGGYTWALPCSQHWHIAGPARVGLRLKVVVARRKKKSVDEKNGDELFVVPIVPVAEKASYAQNPSILLQQERKEASKQDATSKKEETAEEEEEERFLPSAVFADINVTINSQFTEVESTEKLAATAAEERAIRKINGGYDDDDDDEEDELTKAKSAGLHNGALLQPAPRRDWRLIMGHLKRWYMVRPEVRQATVRDTFFARHKYEMSAKTLQQALDEERAVRRGEGGGGRGGRGGRFDSDDDEDSDDYDSDDDSDDFDSEDEDSYGVFGRKNLKKHRAEAEKRKKVIAALRAKHEARKAKLAAAKGEINEKDATKGGGAQATNKNNTTTKKGRAVESKELSEFDEDDAEPEGTFDDDANRFERMARKFPTLEQRLTWIRLNAKEKYAGSVHEGFAVSSCGRFVMWRDGTETPMSELKPFETSFVPAAAPLPPAPAGGSLASSAVSSPTTNVTSPNKGVEGIPVYRFPHRNSDLIGVIPYNSEATAVGMQTNKFTGEVFVCWKQLFNAPTATTATTTNIDSTPAARETYKTHPSFAQTPLLSQAETLDEKNDDQQQQTEKEKKNAKKERKAGEKSQRSEDDDGCPALVDVSLEDEAAYAMFQSISSFPPAAPSTTTGVIGWSVLKGFAVNTTAPNTNQAASIPPSSPTDQSTTTTTAATATSSKKGGKKAANADGKKSQPQPQQQQQPQQQWAEPTFFLVEKKLQTCRVFTEPRYFTSSRPDRGVRIRAEPNLDSRQTGVVEANEVKEATAVHIDKKGNIFIEWRETTTSPGYECAEVTPVPNNCHDATSVSYSVIQSKLEEKRREELQAMTESRRRQQQQADDTIDSKTHTSAEAAAASSTADSQLTRAPTDVNFNTANADDNNDAASPASPTSTPPPPPLLSASGCACATATTTHSSATAAAATPCTLASARAKRSNGGYSLARGPQGVAGGIFLVEIFPFNRTLKPLNFSEMAKESRKQSGLFSSASSSSSKDDNGSDADGDPAVDEAAKKNSNRSNITAAKKSKASADGNEVSSSDEEIIDLDRERERKQRAHAFVKSLHRSKKELIKDPTADELIRKKTKGRSGISDADYQSNSDDFDEDDDDEHGGFRFHEDDFDEEDGDFYGDEEEEDDEYDDDSDDDGFYHDFDGDEEDYDEEDWDQEDDSEDDDFVAAPSPPSKKKESAKSTTASSKTKDAPAVKKATQTQPPSKPAQTAKSTSAKAPSSTAAAPATTASAAPKKNTKQPIVEEPSDDDDDDSCFDSAFGSDDYDKTRMDEGSFQGSDDADQYDTSEEDSD